ncbi:hypothetical protein GCM10027596_01460 [Nocardioides korecus]
MARRVLGRAPAPVLEPELRHTYGLYAAPGAQSRVVWLDEGAFLGLDVRDRTTLVRSRAPEGTRDPASRALCPAVRTWAHELGRDRAERARAQADGHRFLWWPTLLAGHEGAVLRTFVENDRSPSRHDEVPDRVWDGAEALLPGARALAGTFPSRSGPNCFGTVMGAAGVVGAAADWVLQDPFEAWLARVARPARRVDDASPGTVLVWRAPDGVAQHAAVTLGGGWALHKPSQGWMSPVQVLTVAGCLAAGRFPGQRLRRHRLVGPSG